MGSVLQHVHIFPGSSHRSLPRSFLLLLACPAFALKKLT
jgi:hypothetical protein